jgi:hypothetical protein
MGHRRKTKGLRHMNDPSQNHSPKVTRHAAVPAASGVDPFHQRVAAIDAVLVQARGMVDDALTESAHNPTETRALGRLDDLLSAPTRYSGELVRRR